MSLPLSGTPKAATTDTTDTTSPTQEAGAPAFTPPGTEAGWRELLRARNAEARAYEVTRQHGTERPFTGRYEDHYQRGHYHCICCDKPLFRSEAKFDAGCGWPSFDRAISDNAVATRIDTSHGMRRVEVLCPNCGAHLGHVFDDGPTETHARFCMNSASLHFHPA